VKGNLGIDVLVESFLEFYDFIKQNVDKYKKVLSIFVMLIAIHTKKQKINKKIVKLLKKLLSNEKDIIKML